MKTDEIISKLNEALQMEYSDIFLYPREAKLIEDKDISSIFEHFGLMEVRHADLLAMRILNLGGKPEWDFFLLKELTELEDILKRHRDYEGKVVALYAKLIPEVDDETRIILRGIREEEKGHLETIEDLLKKAGK